MYGAELGVSLGIGFWARALSLGLGLG